MIDRMQRSFNYTGSNNTGIGELAFGAAADIMTNASRNAQTVFPISLKGSHRASSYAFVIAMLSITVIMATMFTLFGLFMKAEAHKSPEEIHGVGTGGGFFHGGDILGNDDNFMKSIDIDME